MSNTIPQLNDKLRFLDHMTLNDMAEYFEQQAELCRQKSAEHAFSELERNCAGMDYLTRTPRIVSRFLRQGCSRSEAFFEASKATGAPLEVIERAWSRFCHDKSIYELKRRNRLILELAAFGMTNADIGRKVHMHPNSVSRIISSARKEFQSTRSVDRSKVDLVLKSGRSYDRGNPMFE